MPEAIVSLRVLIADDHPLVRDGVRDAPRDRRFPMKRTIVSLGAGLLFGLGLVVSGMTQPSKVIGFLDITGAWDASLAFVMVGAIGVHAVLILDQAGWHDERALHVPTGITLLPLPAASPQLNPVERVWLYLRERWLSHRVLAGG